MVSLLVNLIAMFIQHTHKLHPRTKHLSVQLHHFSQYVLDRKVTVEKICTTHQRADMFTKALPRDAFRYLRSTISGWQTFARECHEHFFTARESANGILAGVLKYTCPHLRRTDSLVWFNITYVRINKTT